MIPHGHVHTFQPFRIQPHADGSQETWTRCQCGPNTVVEQRILVGPDGVTRAVAVRFGGLWFHPLDLIRLAGVAWDECESCHGVQQIEGGPPCGRCGGIGVTEDGLMVRAPAIRQVG